MMALPAPRSAVEPAPAQAGVFGPGIDEPIATIEAGTRTYHHQDGMGSVIALSNAAGAVAASFTHGPYGETANPSGTAFRYTGRRIDPETGLYYYRARYYPPNLGRFMQTDPIGYQGGINLYAYVGNSPTGLVDPTGLKASPQGGGSSPGLIASAFQYVFGPVNPNQWELRGAQAGGIIGMFAGGLSGGAGGGIGGLVLDGPSGGIVLGWSGAAAGALVGGADGTYIGSQIGYGLATGIVYMQGGGDPPSTGRTEPTNLNEDLAMRSAQSNPGGGLELPIRMTDGRWPAADGWVKMAQNINGIEIHYARNTVTGRAADFKFK